MPESGGSVLKFAGIRHAGKAGSGAFKVNEVQLGWVCTETVVGPSAPVTFLGKDIASAEWQKACGKGKALLKLHFKGDSSASRFAGFRGEEFASLKGHFQKHFGVTLVEQPVSSKGCSWFDWNLDSVGELQLTVDGKAAIDIPLEGLSQVTTGKNELNLEFADDASAMAGDEVIHELRLALPSGDVQPELTADQLKEELQRRTGLSNTGEALARIPDITVVQPRGKHDFEFFKQAVKVHGKTQNYTIKYTSIARGFLLELPTDTWQLAIHLDPPLRQGQSLLLSYLVLTFDKERRVTVEFPKDMLKAMGLKAGEREPVYLLVANILKYLTKKELIAPTTEFKNMMKDGHCCVRCSVKTQPGFLFPLKRSMIFTPKPVIWIRYDEVEGIEFKSSQMRKSSFDLLVQTKRQQAVEFSQLERVKVLAPLYQIFKKMELKIVNASEVESWLSISSTSSRPKSSWSASHAGESAKAGGAGGNADDDDDEEEADEDFEEEASGDGDDSSDDSDALVPDEEEQPKKKKAKRK